MYELTGETYPYRDLIKRMGGRWDAEKKCWTLGSIDPDFNWESRGITVTERAPTPRAKPSEYYPYAKWLEVVNEFKIHSNASYDHLRKSDRRLPPKPWVTYPTEFQYRSMEHFRGHPEQLVRRKNMSLEKRYELYCVPFQKRGLTPPTLTEWTDAKLAHKLER